MKKTMYYLSPFVMIPLIFTVLTLLETVEALKFIAPYFMFAALFLFSAVIGVLSPGKTKFDYAMTAAVPISVFLSLFVALLFDKGCNGDPQLSLHHALNVEYYQIWLPIVAVMTIITFVASFQPIRISKSPRQG